MPLPLVRCCSISKTHAAGASGCRAAARALVDVSVSIYAGELVSLIGSPGAGKTTLLFCLSGLMRPDSGEVIWRDRASSATSRSALVRYVAPTFGQHVFVTAEESLLYHAMRHDAMRHDALGAGARLVDVPELIAALDLRASLRTPVDLLERRMRYRVAVAESLLLGAHVLALDDPPDDQTLSVALGALRPRGLAVLCASPSRDLALATSRILVLQRGSLLEPTDRVLSAAPRRVAEEIA